MTRKPTWLITTALVLTACAPDGTDKPEPAEGLGRTEAVEGAYRYVLGYDEEADAQIFGGTHKVVVLDSRGKAEAIDFANQPRRFHPDLNQGQYVRYDENLAEGETDWDVFASTWWPQSRDGTAWRWQTNSRNYSDLSDRDRLSPMEKYDLTFYPNQGRTVDEVEHCEYRDFVENGQDACDNITRPAHTVAGPATKWELENQGTYQSFDPENWWGHCNGWAAYATSEVLGYPHRDIRVKNSGGNIVECEPGEADCQLWKMADIEALFTELHFSDEATFSGRRCNQSPDEIERDEYGRPVDVECRDMNPGSFHVAIVGLLGHGARNLVTGDQNAFPAFVIDHNYDNEVWNYPIVRYQIHEQDDVTEAQAQELVGATGSNYQFNTQATRFVRIHMSYWMISDAVPRNQLQLRADQRSIAPVQVPLHYVLELDSQNRILGGEWIEEPSAPFGADDSKRLHPDFNWIALSAIGFGENSDDLGGDSDNPFVSYSNALQLLQCANDPETCAPSGGGGGGGGGGGFQPIRELGAVGRGETHSTSTGTLEPGTYLVQLQNDPANSGGDADLYVRLGQRPTTSTYDCRPYLGGSVEQCRVNVTSATRLFVDVRGYDAGLNHFSLVIEREGGGGGGGGGGWDGLDESGAVSRNQEVRFTSPTLEAGDYNFNLTGSGDADLYVRAGAAPTTSTYDCRPYLDGSTESCSVRLTSPGVIHMMVRGYASSSSFRLVAQ